MKKEIILQATKENLDKLVKGMKIKTNNSKEIFEVKAKNANFVIVANKKEYSIISKKPCECKYNFYYNKIDVGDFYFGSDNFPFGCLLSCEYEDLYGFDNEEANKKYLDLLEKGEIEISMRNRCKLNSFQILK